MPSVFEGKIISGVSQRSLDSNLGVNSLADISQNEGYTMFHSFIADQNGAATANIYQIMGAVEIVKLYICALNVVDSTTCSGVYFEIDDGAAQADITNSAAGVDASGISAGGIVAKTQAAANAADFIDNASGVIFDSDLSYKFTVAQKEDGSDTVIRVGYTGDANTEIEFMAVCVFKPIAGGTLMPAP